MSEMSNDIIFTSEEAEAAAKLIVMLRAAFDAYAYKTCGADDFNAIMNDSDKLIDKLRGE